MNKSQVKILELLKNRKGFVKTSEIRDHIIRSNVATLRNLHLLEENGYIDKKRVDKMYLWKLVSVIPDIPKKGKVMIIKQDDGSYWVVKGSEKNVLGVWKTKREAKKQLKEERAK